MGEEKKAEKRENTAKGADHAAGPDEVMNIQKCEATASIWMLFVGCQTSAAANWLKRTNKRARKIAH
jgi:hypothetical protein